MIIARQKDKKNNNVKDVIIYRPNGEGGYKMFFTVPMRITPKVKIQFLDPRLTAILMDDKTRTNTTLTFKVKDNNWEKGKQRETYIRPYGLMRKYSLTGDYEKFRPKGITREQLI